MRTVRRRAEVFGVWRAPVHESTRQGLLGDDQTLVKTLGQHTTAFNGGIERKPMTIHIKYFASLRDRLGRAEDQLDTNSELTVADVWAVLWPDKPLPPNTLAAVNMEYAELTHSVRDGDEVAFFPPVTGG